MEFVYTRQELQSDHAIENTFLLTNGLGGYCSVSSVFSAPRCDQGILVAAVKAPNERINMVHRLSETLCCGDEQVLLSSQSFVKEDREDGEAYLQHFHFGYVPTWTYEVKGIQVVRQCCMQYGANTVSVLYRIRNSRDLPCTLRITPFLKFAPKEEPIIREKVFTYADGEVTCGDYRLRICTDGTLQPAKPCWQALAYPEDAKDGRPGQGLCGSCCTIEKTVQPGEETLLDVTFTMEDTCPTGWEILEGAITRAKNIENTCAFTDPVAKQLSVSADAYIARRDSTKGKTILAGYPLFSDWGRDTMIALPGCTLATGRTEEARSILRTFLIYEQDGLVPNLFPEGELAPMYNTVDAALLLIDCVWQYVRKTRDLAFAWEAWPVLEHIIAGYRKGTHHAIGMDEDGLIYAGQGLDQVTWMDVCVQGILPTPRHGKPVEINAYWYNALMIMAALARELQCDERDYAQLAQQVRSAFREKFYMPERGYLKDVLSGTTADDQIRCNQIWALSMSFTMLEPEQEKKVLDTVRQHLYTPYGLRTLSPKDSQYQGFYGGSQLKRDLAYHQGTTWVFPMGAYYRAWLKVHGYSEAAVQEVKKGIGNLVPMMKQGCAGQLPEIYDGDEPYAGKGCFAQAWSVGEMLRVFDDIRSLDKGVSHK